MSLTGLGFIIPMNDKGDMTEELSIVSARKELSVSLSKGGCNHTLHCLSSFPAEMKVMVRYEWELIITSIWLAWVSRLFTIKG